MYLIVLIMYPWRESNSHPEGLVSHTSVYAIPPQGYINKWPRWESNPYALSNTTPSKWPVYQFQHEAVLSVIKVCPLIDKVFWLSNFFNYRIAMHVSIIICLTYSHIISIYCTPSGSRTHIALRQHFLKMPCLPLHHRDLLIIVICS